MTADATPALQAQPIRVSGAISLQSQVSRAIGWRESLRAVSLPYAFSRLLFLGLTAVLAALRHQTPLDVWNQWDTRWYVGIARYGYHWHTLSALPPKSALAFFPLYPLLLRVGVTVGLPAILAGLLISNVAFLGALFYVHRLATLDFNPLIATRTAWAISLFPTAFFTFAPYTESLFLLSAAAALYFARKDMEWVSGAWLAAAVLTRSTGVILILPVLLLSRNRRPRSIGALLLPLASGIALYAWYLQAHGFPVSALTHAQQGWHRRLTYPWTGFWTSIEGLLLNHSRWNPGMVAEDLLQLGVTVLFLGLTVVARRDLQPPLRLYAGGFWLLTLTSPEWLDHYYAPFSSMDRFVLALFPLAAWAVSRLTNASYRRLMGASVVGLLVLAVVHLEGGWVG